MRRLCMDPTKQNEKGFERHLESERLTDERQEKKQTTKNKAHGA